MGQTRTVTPYGAAAAPGPGCTQHEPAPGAGTGLQTAQEMVWSTLPCCNPCMPALHLVGCHMEHVLNASPLHPAQCTVSPAHVPRAVHASSGAYNACGPGAGMGYTLPMVPWLDIALHGVQGTCCLVPWTDPLCNNLQGGSYSSVCWVQAICLTPQCISPATWWRSHLYHLNCSRYCKPSC